MTTRGPLHKFSIPSLSDGILLECRIYGALPPADRSATGFSRVRGAIVAHPYGPLGGCFDDAVVRCVADELLRAGFIVGTFNFRGSGASQGRTSWSSGPEVADYVSFALFFIEYLLQLLGPGVVGPSGSGSRNDDCGGRLHLVLAGYSYGSVIASQLSSAASNKVRLSNATVKTQLLELARQLAHKGDAASSSIPSAVDTLFNDALTFADIVLPESSKPRQPLACSLLLISPLLAPTTMLVAPTGGWGVWFPWSASQLPKARLPTMCIFGQRDEFTSGNRMKRALEQTKAAGADDLVWREVAYAGHFFREEGAMRGLVEALQEWISTR